MIIDLTRTFTDGMPVFPGDPESCLRHICSIETDGFTDHELSTGLHVGTHMDAPWHMVEGGKKIDEIALEELTGRGVMLDARGRSIIDKDLLEDADIQVADIVIIRTGWETKYTEEDFYKDYPVLTEDFAHVLVEQKISSIILDTPSPDVSPFPVHKILLAHDVYIIENAYNFAALEGLLDYKVNIVPMKLQADAAPVRVYAY